MLRKPDWSRRLPRPIVIPRVMKIATLADARDLIERHLPDHFRRKATWLYAAGQVELAARGGKVTARAKELIAEELALRHLRQARNFTQKRVAELLHMDQGSISKIESRSDMLLSTLRSYVEAMGGSLRLIAEFPDGIAEVGSLGEALDIEAPSKPKKPARTKRRPELVHTR
jgi:transcriptional regulator with XRE-family HTH domain